jgi:hypothetical protein
VAQRPRTMATESRGQKRRAAKAKQEGVPIISPGAPAEGSEAGDAGDVGHQHMVEIGLWTRQRFGCSLHFDGKRYERRRAIDIAHKRFGFSVAYTATAICSIRGEDVSECPHLPDREYWVRGGAGASGHCPVCMAEADCQHRADRLHRVTLTKIITKMDVRDQPCLAAGGCDDLPAGDCCR